MNNTSTFDPPRIMPGLPVWPRTDTGACNNGLSEEEFWHYATASVRHPFKRGEKVTVYRVPLPNRPFIEGWATVLEPIAHMADLYRVQFENECRSRRRLVHLGDWQSNPDRLLAALTDHWRVTVDPGFFYDS